MDALKATKPSRPSPEPHPDARRALLGVVTALLLLGAASAGAVDRPDPHHGPLHVSLGTRFDDAGKPLAIVTVRQPRHALVYRRDGEGFAVRLRVTAIARAGGRQVAGAVAMVPDRVESSAATRAQEPVVCTVTVALPDDRPVELEVRAEVVDSSRWWTRTIDYAPGGGDGIPWYFTTFDWNLEEGELARLRLGARVDSLRLRIGLGRRPGDTAGARPTRLVASLRDAVGAERPLAERPLPQPADAESLTVRLAFATDSFPFGLQTLAIRLEDDQDGRLDLSPARDLVNLDIPFHDDAAWRRHVEWLEMIVRDDGERRVLVETPAPRRAAAWRAVWDARPRDAEPDEAEHLRRIVESDRRFGRFGRGARSDRGRILIIYGEPDRVDSVGMQANVSGEWEVWYYRRLGVKVVFHDPYAMGDFRLYAELPY